MFSEFSTFFQENVENVENVSEKDSKSEIGIWKTFPFLLLTDVKSGGEISLQR